MIFKLDIIKLDIKSCSVPLGTIFEWAPAFQRGRFGDKTKTRSFIPAKLVFRNRFFKGIYRIFFKLSVFFFFVEEYQFLAFAARETVFGFLFALSQAILAC